MFHRVFNSLQVPAGGIIDMNNNAGDVLVRVVGICGQPPIASWIFSELIFSEVITCYLHRLGCARDVSAEFSRIIALWILFQYENEERNYLSISKPVAGSSMEKWSKDFAKIKRMSRLPNPL
jgi:hypothetical protein